MGYYSTTADPSDGWSNHWSNATGDEEEENESYNYFKDDEDEDN